MLANQLQDGRTVSVRAVDDLTGAVVSEGARDAYALPADVQRAMLANKATIYSGHARDDHDRAFARLRYRARTGREETGANPLMLALGRLDWQLGERTLAAPLLLLPVDIKGVVMPYRLAADPTRCGHGQPVPAGEAARRVRLRRAGSRRAAHADRRRGDRRRGGRAQVPGGDRRLGAGVPGGERSPLDHRRFHRLPALAGPGRALAAVRAAAAGAPAAGREGRRGAGRWTHPRR